MNWKAENKWNEIYEFKKITRHIIVFPQTYTCQISAYRPTELTHRVKMNLWSMFVVFYCLLVKRSHISPCHNPNIMYIAFSNYHFYVFPALSPLLNDKCFTKSKNGRVDCGYLMVMLNCPLLSQGCFQMSVLIMVLSQDSCWQLTIPRLI